MATRMLSQWQVCIQSFMERRRERTPFSLRTQNDPLEYTLAHTHTNTHTHLSYTQVYFLFSLNVFYLWDYFSGRAECQICLYRQTDLEALKKGNKERERENLILPDGRLVGISIFPHVSLLSTSSSSSCLHHMMNKKR